MTRQKAANGKHRQASSPVADSDHLPASVPRQRGLRDAGDGGDGPGGRPRRSRRAPRRRRWLLWSVCSLAFLILVAAGGGWLYYQHLNNNIDKKPLNLGTGQQVDKKPPNEFGQTELNILLLGSDDRESAENQRLGGAKDAASGPPRADVQMLLHVSADRSNMSVVSIPRDTMVDIPECKDEKDQLYPAKSYARINESLQHGGPGCTVATWQQITRVHIDHFMMVDFTGVVSMADAVGGVPVCVKDNVYDKKSGLRLTKGTHSVKGEQALQWLRTRYAWGSDILRAEAQHQYMTAMVRELKKGAKLTDPGKLMNLAEAATDALTVDKEGLGSVNKLYDLADELKKVPSDRISMTTIPVLPDPRNPDVTLVFNETEAEKVWKLVRSDTPFDGKGKSKKGAGNSPAANGTPKPAAEVPVTVMNGTGTGAQQAVPRRAAAITDQLKAFGWTQAQASREARSQADTTLHYGDTADQSTALALAKKIGLPAGAVKQVKGTGELELVIGADWREGGTYPAGADKAESKAPDSAKITEGDDAKACMPVYAPYRF